jgi:hypothetical protein
VWVVDVGTNDLGSGETREQIATAICSLHKMAHAHGCRTLAISIPEHHMENRPQYLSIGEKRKGINGDLKCVALRCVACLLNELAHSTCRRFAEAEEKTEFFDLAALLPYFSLADAERRQFWDVDRTSPHHHPPPRAPSLLNHSFVPLSLCRATLQCEGLRPVR